MPNMVKDAQNYVGLFLAFVVGLGIAFVIAGAFNTSLTAGTTAQLAVNSLINGASSAVTTIGGTILLVALLVVLYKIVQPIVSGGGSQ